MSDDEACGSDLPSITELGSSRKGPNLGLTFLQCHGQQVPSDPGHPQGQLSDTVSQLAWVLLARDGFPGSHGRNSRAVAPCTGRRRGPASAASLPGAVPAAPSPCSTPAPCLPVPAFLSLLSSQQTATAPCAVGAEPLPPGPGRGGRPTPASGARPGPGSLLPALLVSNLSGHRPASVRCSCPMSPSQATPQSQP